MKSERAGKNATSQSTLESKSPRAFILSATQGHLRRAQNIFTPKKLHYIAIFVTLDGIPIKKIKR